MQRDSPTDSVTRQAGNGTNPAGTLERGVHRPCGLGAMGPQGLFSIDASSFTRIAIQAPQR